MIESRYSIEYVDPNSGSIKTSLGKLLIYTLLILSITLITLAILISTFSENSSSLITRKFQEFSNIDSASINKTVKEIFTPTETAPSAANHLENTDTSSDEIQQQLSILEQRNADNKKEIDRLSLDNANKLSSYTELSTNFDALSKQLAEEKLKSERLTKEVKRLKVDIVSKSALLEEAKTRKINIDQVAKSKPLKSKQSHDKVELTNSELANTVTAKSETEPTLASSESEKQTKQEEPIKTQADMMVSTMQKQELSTLTEENDIPKPLIIPVKESADKNNSDSLVKQKVEPQNSAVDAIVAAMQAEKKLAPSNLVINNKKITTEQIQTTNKQPRTITVKQDETIWGIAERIYGNGSHYKKIIEANPTLDLKKIREGLVLKIPE